MIILATSIEKNQNLILRYLLALEEKSGTVLGVHEKVIAKGTGLTPYQIGTALELLKSRKLVDAHESLLESDSGFISTRLTAKGRLRAEKLNLEKRKSTIAKSTKTIERSKNPRDVFVVHGRDLVMRDALYAFLRALDLRPLEWTELIKRTRKGTPYVGEVLDKAFSEAQAVVVLMTPDDEGCLLPSLRGSEEPSHERELTPQARLNVIFEAGIAMGYCPKRTVIVEIGQLRPFSDITGRHTVRMDNSPEKRLDLAQRLENAGCKTNRDGTEWLSVGDFSRKLGETRGIEPTINSKFAKKRKSYKVSPEFAHLTILYSRRIDSPDNPNPARPRYVLNNRTNQAYRVSTWLEPYIAHHKINWHTFESKEALMQYFKEQNVYVCERDPTPEELGIVLDRFKQNFIRNSKI